MKCYYEHICGTYELHWSLTSVAEKSSGLLLWSGWHDGSHNVTGEGDHDDKEEQDLGLGEEQSQCNY